MRKHTTVVLICIVLLAAFAVVINIPPQINVFGKSFPGFHPNFFIGPIHIQRDVSLKKGLDLEGGTSITLKADMNDVPEERRDDALTSAKEVIEKRVNFFGVSEPLVQTAKVSNEYRIIAEIPGITDVNQAIELIGTTAKMTFWEEGASGSATLVPKESLPFGLTQLLGENPKPTDLTGSDLQQTQVSFDPNTGNPQVQLIFTAGGGKKFATITGRNVGKIVAIVLDNQVIEAPRVQDVITQGNAVITGSFTTKTAKALSVQLNAGALPVPLSVLEQHAIGATLGSQSLQKSLFAGVIGFIVIVIFMCVLYGRLGIIASMALLIYALTVLAIFRLVPVTLTLAGIAGFILSIGIAVDANILIFERMREEVRSGKPLSIALSLGFHAHGLQSAIQTSQVLLQVSFFSGLAVAR